MAVLLRPEQRIDQWKRNADDAIARFSKRLPAGLSLAIIMEQNTYVEQRMQTLARNLLLGVSAVSIVTLIFMGWRSSLLVTATLPLASLMVVSGMQFLGIPIHQMSITGLIIALGLLIDNAIIAADEIDLSMQRGFTPREAVGDMVSRLFAPLLASTVTTALAFAPISLMEGPAGEFVGSIAITVMLAIFSSLLLAMAVLPATAALLQQRVNPSRASTNTQSENSGWFRQMLRHGLSIPAITNVYRRFLGTMLHNPLLGVLVGAALPVAGFMVSTQLDEQFFPPADRDQFYVEIELEPQATIAATESLARRIDEVLHAEKRIIGTSWFLGESAPPFYYNVISRRKNSPNYGQAIVTLRTNRDALFLIRRLQLELDNQFPEAQILVRQLEQGPPFDAPVEIRIFGSELEQLKQFGQDIRALSTRVPNVLHSRTALDNSRPIASVQIANRPAAWAGLDETQISEQLFASLQGLQAGTIIEGVEEIPVRVRMRGADHKSIDELGTVELFSPIAPTLNTVANAGGKLAVGSSPWEAKPIALNSAVPVSAIADVSLKPQKATISRYNGRRVNEVQCFITAGTLPSVALADLLHAIDQSNMREMPPGFEMEIGGEAAERDAAVGRLMQNVSVLAVGMVAALVLALSSFRLAALIGIVATLATGLGLGALWLFGYPFGFMAIVGTMGLIGIAINDSIVVISALGQSADVRAGQIEATIDTVVEVTRHVLATTATTVVGFAPLVLSGGGFWPPLAVAIGTGVAGATLISLTLVPCLFRLMGRNSAPAKQ